MIHSSLLIVNFSRLRFILSVLLKYAMNSKFNCEIGKMLKNSTTTSSPGNKKLKNRR